MTLDLISTRKFDARYAELVEDFREKSSKLSRVGCSPRIMRMLAIMLSLGTRFRSMSLFSVNYLRYKFIGIHGGVSNFCHCDTEKY
jgi:hypothetical protein